MILAQRGSAQGSRKQGKAKAIKVLGAGCLDCALLPFKSAARAGPIMSPSPIPSRLSCNFCHHASRVCDISIATLCGSIPQSRPASHTEATSF